jgi:uncharacterized protein with PQ loop repeat
MDLEGILSLGGSIFCILLCFSPTPAYITAWKTKDLRSISHGFLIANLGCQGLFSIYFFLIGITGLGTLNAFTGSVCLVMLFIYHIIKGDFATMCPALILVIGIAVYVCLELVSSTTVGLVATIFNFYLVGATLPELIPAIAEKNPVYINFTIIIAGLLNCICWTGFGFLVDDIFIISPNLAGLVLSIIQIYIGLWA